MTTDQIFKNLDRILNWILAAVVIAGSITLWILHAFAVLFIALMSIVWRR